MAITLTYTFVPNTTILSAEVNANFSTLATRALDKTGDTMTGDLLFTDALYDIGKSGATRPRDIFLSRALVAGTSIVAGTTLTAGTSLLVGTSATFGSGSVALIGSDGKINGPLSSTIIDDLSGANLTTLNGSNISSGTVPTARLGSGSATSTTVLFGNSTWGTVIGGLQLVSYTTAAAASTITISGLNLNTDLNYDFVVETDLLSAVNNIYLRMNDNSTADQNWVVSVIGTATAFTSTTSTGVGQVQLNGSTLSPATDFAANISLRIVRDGRPALKWEMFSGYDGGDGAVQWMGAGSKNATTNVTSVRIFTSAGATCNWRVWCLKSSTS